MYQQTRHGRRRWAPRILLAIAVVAAAGLAVGLALNAGHTPGKVPSAAPPRNHLPLLPAGSYAHLPDDAAASAEVDPSTWEPRPGNAKYNGVMPTGLVLKRVPDWTKAYDPRWNTYVLGRITGHFTGTTDEIFQWAAAKWGLPDDLIRTVAWMESEWHQANYGDYVEDLAQCPPGYRKVPCPVTFGIVGTKSTGWPGIFPWNKESTAAAVDVLGGWLRGCYEGWVWWLRDHGNLSRGVYHAGNIWGCVGAWYSGNWLDGTPSTPNTGENYLTRAEAAYHSKPWLQPGF